MGWCLIQYHACTEIRPHPWLSLVRIQYTSECCSMHAFYLVALARLNSISHITTKFVLSGFVDSLIAEKRTTDLRTCPFLGIVATLTPVNYGSKDFYVADVN